MNPTEREQRLAAVIDRYRYWPFTWGEHDCVLFAARCIDAQCDSTFELRLRREFDYHNGISAYRAIKAGGGFERLLSRYLGPAMPPTQAEVGDVVLAQGTAGRFDNQQIIGICDEEKFIAPDELCLSWVPMKFATHVWKCPHPDTGAR